MEVGPGPNTLAPCASGRSIGIPSSPEFEFCSSFSQSDLVSAADLFSDGLILPLHRQLRLSDDILPPPPPTDPEPSWFDRPPPDPEIYAEESARLSASPNAAASSSMRWMNIFRKSDKKPSRRSIDMDAEKDIISAFREMSKKRERRNSIGGVGAATPAELNINIWPFARSRSAGNGASRPQPPRKVSSAPCSRSNSGGESKSRRWPGSPGRGGIPIGRSSPVWQARRSGGGRRSSEAVVNEGRRKIPLPGGGGRGKGKVSSLNVVGNRQQSSCRREESSTGGVARGGRRVSGEEVRGGSLFNIKSLFTKKVY